ncbi:hypothetical protein [Blastococcus sp. SYSU D01042]
MAPTISVRPEVLAALADRLTDLAVELADDGERCLAAAGTLRAALRGTTGETAGAVALAWGALAGGLAEGTGAVAGTLRAAGASYRRADAGLAGSTAEP